MIDGISMEEAINNINSFIEYYNSGEWNKTGYVDKTELIKKIYFETAEGYDSPTIRTIIDFPSADVQPIQWISCKDNMPDTLERGLSTMYSDCCLVCDAFGWVGMAYYITDGQKSWWEFADAQNKNKIDWTEVTHWMPLPEPPKDGDVDE